MRAKQNERTEALLALLEIWQVDTADLLTAMVEPLLAWYGENARELAWRANKDPYRVWLSEIMLQQTRVEAVKGYYARFLTAFPTVFSLAQAEEEQVLKLWEGLGYYSRARNLQKTAKLIAANNGEFPTDFDGLRKLPGIGDYTAGAIASICFDRATPAVDGNVLRVVSRLTELMLPINGPKVKQAVFAALEQVYPQGRCGDMTQALMELGATVCVPNGAPHCVDCPLSSVCRANQNGTVGSLPLKATKKARTVEEKTVFCLSDGQTVAVQKREAKGLLAGMWQLPEAEGFLNEDGARKILEAWGIEPLTYSAPYHRKHIFTHREWHMQCYTVRVANRSPKFTWADDTMLRESIALPTAFRICLERDL